MATQNEYLDGLLSEPREALDVEVKAWLDLTDHDQKATVAKEVIALANHGGGYLVIGFEELTDGSFRAASQRPANLDGWSQDAIQSIIAKYVDPTIQSQRVVHGFCAPVNSQDSAIAIESVGAPLRPWPLREGLSPAGAEKL